MTAYRPDLHMHSTASDGEFTPAQLVSRVAASGVNLFALTDHETMAGLNEAKKASEENGLTFIPGIEINTEGHDEVHVLLYFVHEGMDELVSLCRLINEDRRRRGERLIKRLNELDVAIEMSDVDIPEGTFCNRPHIANALVKLRRVSSFKEAFDRYLAVGKPAYVERTRIKTLDIIAMAKRIGALPVLAHPDLIRRQELRSKEAIAEMAEAGLAGIEAYHSIHDASACRRWEQTARSLGLLVTGGSDFHRPSDQHGPIGCMLEKWTDANRDAALFLEAHEKLMKGKA